MEAALLKSVKQWPEREWAPARDVLNLTLIESGEDLVAYTGSEIFEFASELPSLTPVVIGITICEIKQGGVARLWITRLEAEIDGERLVAVDRDCDDSAKTARRKLSAYAKSISR